MNETPLLKQIKNMVKSAMGPFSNNPKVDDAYVTLRLMGLSEDDAKEVIYKEIYRRGLFNPPQGD